jgi:hypothetical protein
VEAAVNYAWICENAKVVSVDSQVVIVDSKVVIVELPRPFVKETGKARHCSGLDSTEPNPAEPNNQSKTLTFYFRSRKT